MSRSRATPTSHRPGAAPAKHERRAETVTSSAPSETAQRRIVTTEALIDCVDLLCERLKAAGGEQ